MIARWELKFSLPILALLFAPGVAASDGGGHHVIGALYLGMLVALLAYNLLLYLSLRDRAYLYYVLFAASMALGLGSWSGLLFDYLWSAALGWGSAAAIIGFDLAGLFGALFAREFLSTPWAAPKVDRLLTVGAALFALLLPAGHLLPDGFHAALLALVAVALALAALAGGLICRDGGLDSARFFVSAWGVLLFGALVLWMRCCGWVPAGTITLNVIQATAVVAMLLLSFALADRIGALRRDKEAAESKVTQTRLDTVEALARTGRELERRVRQRTKELTHLTARLRERESRFKSLAFHDALTGLANRLHLEERLELALGGERNGDGGRVGVLMLDLDGFKPVNDTYGHEMGDELLKVVAKRLLGHVRAQDTVVRLGGDEFLVLLEGIDEPDHIVHIGDKLIAEVGAPIEIEGCSLRVGLSVGAALHPHDGEEAVTLVKRADRAMYRAKHDGRNCLRMAPGLAEALGVGEEAKG